MNLRTLFWPWSELAEERRRVDHLRKEIDSQSKIILIEADAAKYYARQYTTAREELRAIKRARSEATRKGNPTKARQAADKKAAGQAQKDATTAALRTAANQNSHLAAELDPEDQA